MKERFIKSTLILLIGGMFTKILGIIIKIMMSRILGTEGIGLYMIILPTFSLFISISQFGLPIALSKLVAEDKYNNRNLFYSIIPVTLIVNTLLIIVIFLIAPILSNNLLHNNDAYYSIISISFVIPFTAISSICRSYFFGKEKMIAHVISNIIEDIVRLIIIMIFLPLFISKGIKYSVCFIILSNIISEIFSTIVLILFLPRKFKFKFKNMQFNNNYLFDVLNIGVYYTTGRFISSIGYFLEPIILTSTLVYIGYSTKFITYQYGIITGYVLPILLLPSFFSMAISQSLLPVVSRDYSDNNIKSVKRKIRFSVTLSFFIGLFFTLLFIIIPELFLRVLYNTNLGVNYMRILAPFCLFQYIQAPLVSSLDAMGFSKTVMRSSIISTITRCTLLFICSLFHIGLYGLVISTSINIIVITIYIYKKLLKKLNKV